MIIEDDETTMSKLGFVIGIPTEVDPAMEDTLMDDDQYMANLIRQNILRYVAGKLENLCARCTIVEEENVVTSIKNATSDGSTMFIALKIQIDRSVGPTNLGLHYFDEYSESAVVINADLKERMDVTGYFKKVIVDGNPPPAKIGKDPIPMSLMIMAMGNDLLCTYNSDADSLIMKIGDTIVFAIVDNCTALLRREVCDDGANV